MIQALLYLNLWHPVWSFRWSSHDSMWLLKCGAMGPTTPQTRTKCISTHPYARRQRDREREREKMKEEGIGEANIMVETQGPVDKYIVIFNLGMVGVYAGQ